MTEIWTARADGSSPRRVKTYLGEPGDVCFLPEGEGLVYLQRSLAYAAFGSHLSGGHDVPMMRNRVWRVALDGSEEALWPLPGDLHPLGIAVSPDGEMLAVGGCKDGLPAQQEPGLWTVDREGNARMLLSGWVCGPLAWLADGRRVFCGLEARDGVIRVAVGLDGVVLADSASAGSVDAPVGFDPDGAMKSSDRRRMQAALAQVVRARSRFLKGYFAEHAGDYDTADKTYRLAILEFENVYKQHRKAGISRADCEGYIHTLASRRDMAKDARERRMCQEHMLVVGDMTRRCAAAHGDSLPARLEDVSARVRGQIEARATDTIRLERDVGALARLFHCTGDLAPERVVSYEYRSAAPPGTPALRCLWHPGWVFDLSEMPVGYRVAAGRFGADQVDSLTALAARHLEAGDPARAYFPLETAARHRGDAEGYTRLGNAYLQGKEDLRAENAYRKALSVGRREELADAFYGLGRIYIEYPRERSKKLALSMAVEYLTDALSRNPDHVDARYQKAKARYLMAWQRDSREDIEKLLKMYPDHVDAYRLMGDWYLNYGEDYPQAIMWYTRYMKERPDDAEVRRGLGRAYLKLQDYDMVLENLLGFVQAHPEAVDLMPIVAQACMKREKYDMAVSFFQAYVSRMDEADRKLFEDIRLIASDEELAEYAQTFGAERGAFLKRFWNGRDPDITTPVNERLLEHYRRVWYSQMEFAEGKQPWDARGEVYIRFGEPDHRTTSRDMEISGDLDVQRVKERMALDIYGAQATTETYVGPVFPVRSMTHDGLWAESLDAGDDIDIFEKQREAAEEEIGGGGALASAGSASSSAGGAEGQAADDTTSFAHDLYKFSSYQPVTASRSSVSIVPWECWVYTRVGGGIEITFTDEMGNGTYDYAPVPPTPAAVDISRETGTDVSLRRLSRFARYAPRTVFERAAAAFPDYYVPDYEAQPFDFYFDVADFRGRGDRSVLEVYYGIPRTAARYVPEGDVTRLMVDRQAALIPTEADTVFRRAGELDYQVEGNRTHVGGFVPDVVRFEAPPGFYRLEVRARNRLNGRLGIYRKLLRVDAYGQEALELSDLQLAWRVSETPSEDKFSKGGLHVIPMPTRRYRKGENVFVYYEVYNLKRDEFGQTRYKVEYTIRPLEGANRNIIARLAQTLTGKKREEVAVGYEQVGLAEVEATYVELDLDACYPARHELRVMVTDLNSGEVVVKEATFTVVE